MNDQDVGVRMAAILASPRAEIDQTEVLAIVHDAMRPLAVGTTGEIATMAGTNYRDRQNLKRKASRWRRRQACSIWRVSRGCARFAPCGGHRRRRRHGAG